MKLRIEGQTLRIRLSEEDIQTFRTKNLLKHCIGFGDDHQLCYSLVKEVRTGFDLKFRGSDLQVMVPVEQAILWLDSNQIGIEDDVEIDDATVRIIVEKDLKPKKERYK